MKFKKTFKELNKQLKSWEDMEFPRIKQPKPQFPKQQEYKPLTDEEEQEIINKVDYSIHEKGAR